MRSEDSKKKVYIYSVLIISVPYLLFATGLLLKKQSVYQRLVEEFAKTEVVKLDLVVAGVGEQLILSAEIMASSDVIQKAFMIQVSDTMDKSLVPKMMNDYVNKISVLRENPIDYGLQVFASPAIVMYKSWEEGSGEDLSFVRKSVVAVDAFRKSVWAVEADQLGLKLRGVAPVYNSDATMYLGSLEVYRSFDIVLEHLASANSVWCLYVPDKIQRNVKKTMKKHSSDFHKVDGFSFASGNTTRFNSAVLGKDRLLEVWQNQSKVPVVWTSGRYSNVAFVMFDYNQNPIGIAVCQYDFWILGDVIPNQILLFVLIGFLLWAYIVFILVSKFYSQKVESIFNLKVPRFFYKSPEFISMSNFTEKLLRDEADLHLLLTNPQTDLGVLTENNRLEKSWAVFKDFWDRYNLELKQKEIEFSRNKWRNDTTTEFNRVLHFDYSTKTELLQRVAKFFMKITDSHYFVVYIRGEESDKLVSEVAYASQKQVSVFESITFGDGYIGTCALERKRIYLKSIPTGYIKIVSGLGDSNPNELLILPIITRHNLLGVVEMATLNVYNEEQIEFMEFALERTGSRLFNFIQTSRVEELKQQLEFCNDKICDIEEKSKILFLENLDLQNVVLNQDLFRSKFAKLFQKYFFYIEYQLNSKIRFVNRNYLELFDIDLLAAKQLSFYDGMNFDNFDEAVKDEIWNRLLKGESIDQLREINFENQSRKIWEFYSPHFQNGTVKYIVKFAMVLK